MRGAVATLFAALLLTACEAPSEPALAPYWQVTTDDGRTSILLGTIHSVVDAGSLPETLWDALSAAAVVTTEADMRAIDNDEFLAAISLPEGVTIRPLVSLEDWNAIQAAFLGIYSPGTVDHLQPWFLESALVRSMLPAVETIDTALVAAADEQGVELAFLETWQQQVEYLNALGMDDGLEVLLATVHDPDAAVAAYHAWADAYRAGDVEELTRLTFAEETMAARPQFYEQIVHARNDAWLPALEAQVAAGDAFIGVGFMHMLTERGLVQLLQDRGYEVTVVERP